MSKVMAMPGDTPVGEQDVLRARLLKVLSDLDYRRVVRRAARTASQSEIARWAGVSQPTVHSTLHTAERDPEPVEGFSGATPTEICERYAAGLIGRDELIDELARFPYEHEGTTDGYDWLVENESDRSFRHVLAALDRGLIDDGIYAELFARLHPAR